MDLLERADTSAESRVRAPTRTASLARSAALFSRNAASVTIATMGISRMSPSLARILVLASRGRPIRNLLPAGFFDAGMQGLRVLVVA